MAGERLAKLTLEVSLAEDDQVRGIQTEKIRFVVAGVVFDPGVSGNPGGNQPFEYRRGAYGSNRHFPVPDPGDVGRDYVLQAVQNIQNLLRSDIQAFGKPYVVSAPRDLGNDPQNGQPRIAFDVEATLYDPTLDPDFDNLASAKDVVVPVGGVQRFVANAFKVTQRLRTLRPIVVQQLVTPAGVYGSATGSIVLLASAGNTGPFTYTWADTALVTDFRRLGVGAGTYTCVVRDGDGVTATVTCVVASDAQLLVTVQQTEDSITLQVSGGVPPYAVAWDDGPTSFVRLGLATGSYGALVTDDRGASQRVDVTLLANRCYFSRNPVRLALDAGAAYRADPTTKPGLSFVAQVWVEKQYLSGLFEQVGPQLEQPADATGRTVFDVQALLDTCVREHLPALPATVAAPGLADAAGGASDLLSPAPAVRAEGLFTRFYLKWAEKFGSPPVAAALSQAQVHVVLCGGLGPEEAANGYWPAYQAAVQPFLHWEPGVPAVLPTQPAYRYYQHAHEAGDVQLWRRATYADGSSSVALVTTLVGVRRWEVYALAVGPAQLGLSGPDVVYYSVWATDPAGQHLSHTAYFQLDRAYYPRPRYFLYSNSLGGVNVLAALGAGKLALEVTATEAERPAYVPGLGDVATLDRRGVPTLSVSTGPRPRAQVEADQELLLSRRVTLLSDGQYWPGRVAAGTYVVRDESAGLASLSFDFTLAAQRHFSPRLPWVVAGRDTPRVAGGEGGRP